MRFEFSEFQLDNQRFTLSGPAGNVHVEPQVFALLVHLIANRDRVVSKEELLDTVWGDRFVSASTLTSRVKAARQAVGDDGQSQRIIRTVHARGYQFVAEVRADARGLRGRLPRLRNAPIGRDADVASLVERSRGAPLVTITGSGGIGKTTVALVVADVLETEFADGVVFVDLSPVPAHADVTAAVADAAGVEGAASETIERVADHLGSRPVLVVLDNCEHVLGRAAELVARMLRHGDAAHVLATSREPLGLIGEQVWPLGPLHDDGPTLFVERARAAEPRAEWHPNDPAVIEICRRLDGVPLALELAAGQLRRFELDELNRRLDDQLALLSARGSGDEARHASMETVIDWSYRLLDDAEQSLLRHLGVFPSVFDVEAAEAVASAAGRETATVVAFGQLVDKSLVVHPPGSNRYQLLETIRIFARNRLDEAGEAAEAFARHRGHVRQRVGSVPRLDRWMSGRRGAEFRTQSDDARQAFRHSLRHDDPADGVEIAIGASFLWRNAMGCTEGEAWIGDLSDAELSARDQLWLHIMRADLGQGRGDFHQLSDAAAAAELVRDGVEDPAGACLAAYYGALARFADPELARDGLTVALDLARQSRDPRLVTLVEVFLAVADLTAGRHDRVHAAVTRLDQVASEDGYDRFLLHWSAWMLGLAERDAVAARGWMSRQQDFLDRTGIIENWLTTISTALCDVIDTSDARAMLARTLHLADAEGYEADADCVLVLAYAEMVAGRFTTAAELVGTAMHDGFNATAHYLLYRAVLHPMLREQLDARAWTEAMWRGRERSPAQALAEHGVARGLAEV